MRKHLAFLIIVAVSLSVSPRTKAYSQDCSVVTCGFRCHVLDSIDGWCNAPADAAIGCVQLDGPNCASMESSCCQTTGGVASF